MTVENEIRQIEIHLPGILKLLSEHLYSDYRVALRELTQNAYDSCIRRKIEDTGDSVYVPEISITFDSSRKELCFEDNGSGLTREEIIDYVATIGKGYTGELRTKLETEGRSAALELVGQFGLGLLAAFIIAESVTITTRSYQPGSQGWKWHSDGHKSYALRKVTVHETGTRVLLKLKKEYYGLLKFEKIREAILEYADFLQVPIYVGGRSQPINSMVGPWEPPVNIERCKRFIYNRFGETAPLFIMPVNLTVPAQKGLEQGLTIQGLLYIPSSSVISIKEHGSVAVYIRRMLITPQDADLLPSWARFVTGVIECPQLTPTVSRESIKKNVLYQIVKEYLEKTLITELLNLSKTDPEQWNEIVKAHNNLIKSWALASNNLFMSICDIVTFRTSQGDITLKDYLRRNPGVVYYYKNLDGLSQTEALFEAQGLPVIDARFFPEEAFLMKYAKCHPGIKLEHLKPGAQFIFTDVQDPANQWGKLTDVLAGYGVVCRLTRFSPPEIPAVLIVTEDIKVARKLKKTSFERERSESTLVFIKDFLDRVSPDERFDKGILHINTASPILRALLDMPADSPHFRNVIEIIYHNARLFSGKSLTAREILDDFIGINRNLENILAAVGFSAQARDFLDPGVFIEMGLSSAKAKEIAGYCETIKEFRACDPETLAGKVKLPAKIIKALQSAVESG